MFDDVHITYLPLVTQSVDLTPVFDLLYIINSESVYLIFSLYDLVKKAVHKVVCYFARD